MSGVSDGCWRKPLPRTETERKPRERDERGGAARVAGVT